MPLFRFHRGGLDESLKTVVVVKNMHDLMKIISCYHEKITGKEKYDFGIMIGPYPAESKNFDERIGWYTQMVTSDIIEHGTFVPVGFLSEPLE